MSAVASYEGGCTRPNYSFVMMENFEPVLALEVKSNRSKKRPTPELLSRAGLACPVGTVNKDNLEAFLMTVSLEEAFAVAVGAR
jgi:hypothetical protein